MRVHFLYYYVKVCPSNQQSVLYWDLGWNFKQAYTQKYV